MDLEQTAVAITLPPSWNPFMNAKNNISPTEM